MDISEFCKTESYGIRVYFPRSIVKNEELFNQLFQHVISECKRLNERRILCEVADSDSILEDSKLMEMAEFCQSHLSHLAIAIHVPEHQKSSNSVFVENTFNNKGNPCQYFNEFDNAVKHLENFDFDELPYLKSV